MAARSVTVNFVNNSDVALIQDSTSLSHGIWTTQPPARIEAGTTVSWESESSGVATGTEGEATFKIETGPGQTDGSAHFHWDNPFVGSNSYDEATPVGYKVDRSGGDGDNATVNWTFDCSSATCDGIPDDWKKNGVTIDPGDGSGPQFIDLPSMGATVNTPDIFIQLDWMADATHSHALSAAAIKSVVTAFKNAPFKSRTGSVGINLHVDHGPASIMNFATNQTWGALSRARQLPEVPNLGTGGVNNYSWAAFDAIKNALGGFKSTGQVAIFRYAISAHQISNLTNSGVARTIPGSDFIISLAPISLTPTDLQQAGTFMHELGHNLGLQHGGGDNVNNKPNYISIMNYLFQLVGLTRAGLTSIVDYSNVALNALNEVNLDETTGVGAAASGVATSHWLPAAGGNPAGFVSVADASKAIDWNGNGLLTDKNVAFDVNNDGVQTTLTPYDDWKNLKLKGGSIGAGGDAVQPMVTVVDEITPEQAALVLPRDTTPPITTAFITPTPNPAGWNRTDVVVTLSATDDISGVAHTEYVLDGVGPTAGTGPISITAEGIHTLQFHSIDRSQNVEATKKLVIRIDKTPPEEVITYDPVNHQVVVTGRDALSGVNPGAVSPISVTPSTWTEFGSDTAQVRTYLVVDQAGNSVTLTMKVKCEPDEYELSVMGIRYNEDPTRCEQTKPHKPQRNTIEFERLIGRGLDHPLLGVTQEVSFGEGTTRGTVEATWDVLHDEPEIQHWTGDCNCGQPRGDRGKSSDQQEEENDPEQRGLILLRVVTDRGRLKLEE
ncbi:MAG TPA: hypothetical protein VF173_12395 [Thermoanaerobaculia bacterium]|nr:hypothetical protein [Thermoanaerobaculia bacterium]